jgi:hypothetical protein
LYIFHYIFIAPLLLLGGQQATGNRPQATVEFAKPQAKVQ